MGQTATSLTGLAVRWVAEEPTSRDGSARAECFLWSAPRPVCGECGVNRPRAVAPRDTCPTQTAGDGARRHTAAGAAGAGVPGATVLAAAAGMGRIESAECSRGALQGLLMAY